MAEIRAVSLVVVFVVAACATPIQTGSDHDKAASFSSFHTFAMMQREHPGITNPLVVPRARDAIKQQLENKGFRQADDPSAADFVVDFTIGSRDRVNVTSYPAPFAGPWQSGGPWWGSPYWGNNIDVRQYQEGTLAIDIFDGHTHDPVWHGWARKELSRRDIEQSEEPIRRAVAAVLEKFPPH
jgi:hypothetical protein